MRFANGTFIPDSVLGQESAYNYLPTLWICALVLALFSLSTLIHLGQALYFRTYYALPTLVVGGIGEIIGWSARLWSSINILADDPFTIQISTTIISPTFLSAANFLILGQVISIVGPRYSRLSPLNYSRIFITIDIFALVIQAVGGGIASSANTSSGTTLGGHIMLAGIIIQLVAIAIYMALGAEFLHRVFANRPISSRVNDDSPRPTDSPIPMNSPGASDSIIEKFDRSYDAPVLSRNIKLMLLSLASSSLFLFIRAIYRTIELSDGWNGHVISVQVYFNVLDGAMIILSMYTLNLLHPGLLLNTRAKNSAIA